MIPFALLVAPLPITAAALFSNAAASNTKPTKSEPAASSGSWNWLHPAKSVLIVHLWALIISFLPPFISQIPLTALSSLLALYPLTGFANSNVGGYRWQVLKSVMIAAASIGLSLMSIINFSTALVGSIILVPMYLMVRPLKRPMEEASLLLSSLLRVLNVLLAVAAFPPATVAILKGFLLGFGSVGVGDFWEWAEFLWVWNSATYLYVTLVHLPCWYLCVRILVHN